MIKPALPNHFRNCLVSLLKLHDLQLAGNDDSSDAETVRAALDLEWPLLSMREQTAWIELSDLLLVQKADLECS
jgi:hypothetical protein